MTTVGAPSLPAEVIEMKISKVLTRKNNNNPATQRKDTEKVDMKKVSSVSKILLLLLFLRSQICDLRSKKIFLRNFHFKVSNAKKKRNTHPPPSLPPKNSLYYSYMREGVRGGGVVTPLL